MDSARYKLPLLQGLYILSTALPIAAACFVLGISYETIYYGIGIGVYAYLTMLLVSAPCLVLWLVTRLTIKKRKLGNLAWVAILGLVVFLHSQPQFWAFPAAELEAAKQDARTNG